MTPALKPWTRAAFELIVHAELHLRDGGDFDRRMAHIGFDNAIEVAITTYLGLKPIQRQNKSYAKADVEKWMTNYHTKLEFLEQEARSRGWSLKIPNDEVVFYHDIRNGQYHAGGPGVPESDHLSALRTAALDTFAMLFVIQDIDAVLEEHVQKRLASATLHPPRNSVVDKLLDIENEPVVIAGQPYAVSEALYATDPNAYAAVAASFKESRDCVEELKTKHPQSVDPGVIHISFVHFEESVYLKVVRSNGEVTLTDTEFVAGSDVDECFFSCSRSPDENADLLIHQFDAYSIINCFDLFTRTAAERIAMEYETAERAKHVGGEAL
jgi:hypothetical protein